MKENNFKELSIITVCLNERKYIEKTCLSIINQTFKNFEWLVIDGGSTDGTLEILNKYKKFTAYFTSEQDNGIYHAMNKGIHFAKGKYLLFLNGGDYLHDENTLENVFNEIDNEDIVIGYLKILEKEIYPFKNYTIKKDYIYYYPIPLPAAFIKQKLFEKYGYYDETYKIAADQDFFLRCIRKKALIKKIMVLVAVFNLEGLGSTSNELTKKERKILFKKNYNFFERIIYKLICLIKKHKLKVKKWNTE